MKWIRFLAQLITDSFAFSPGEARGLLVLLILIVTMAILPRIYLTRSSSGSLSSDPQALAQWKQEIEQSIQVKQAEKPKREGGKMLPVPTLFDPNSASAELMQACGLSQRVAQGAVKFREAGGVFRTKDDIRKLYGINDDMIREVWGYLDLPEKREYAKSESGFKPGNKKQVREFELNTASVIELVQLYGIGEKRAELILKYRERLGGFATYEQLLEVYSLTPEVVDTIRTHTRLSVPVQTISLNTDSVKWLTKHPYINYKLGQAIFNYRKTHGDFRRVEDVRNIKILSDSLYHKLSPYLSL
jgi:competence protein ComEA